MEWRPNTSKTLLDLMGFTDLICVWDLRMWSVKESRNRMVGASKLENHSARNKKDGEN